jgi:Fungal tRNA ligase phosphodiesterase domain
MKGILWLTLQGQISPVEAIYNPANHLHVTIQFNVEHSEVEHLLGREVMVYAYSNCSNGRIQALRVELPEEFHTLCGNECPHMTISHLPNVRPVESNVMLQSDHNSLACDLVLATVAEFQPFRS